jgi:hypothetical protein
MKTIVLLAIAAMFLQNLLGTQSSVGGPMTMMLIFFLTILAVGFYEAISKQRGAPGLIVSIVTSVIGGIVAVALIGPMIETIIPYLGLNGSLASSQHPMLYILQAGMVIFIVSGSWFALQAVNRLR